MSDDDKQEVSKSSIKRFCPETAYAPCNPYADIVRDKKIETECYFMLKDIFLGLNGKHPGHPDNKDRKLP